jgi:aminoglycoside phosphotransferase (APT) family kinase protein
MIYQPLNAEKLQAYLAFRMPERHNLRIAKVKRSYPGMSRETWWITTEWDENSATKSERFVIRLDPPGGGLSLRSLRDECEVYRRLFATDVPVPELLYYENSPEWLLEGRDFSVRKWVDGDLEPAHIRDMDSFYDDVRVETVKELMRRLAAIHALDWKALKFDEFMTVPSSPETCGIEALQALEKALDDHARQPLPAFYEALYWFMENPPPVPKRICVRKENNGIGEEVWDGTKIVAMCDWETASLGDPALDLAVAFGTTVKYWDEEKALAYYNEISGNQVSMAAVRWYQQFWHFQAGIWLHAGLRNFVSGRDRRVQLAVLGGPYVYMSQESVTRVAGF